MPSSIRATKGKGRWYPALALLHPGDFGRAGGAAGVVGRNGYQRLTESTK
jgi:hypothetical protein